MYQSEFNEEIRKMSIDLERINGVFCQLWELGVPKLSDKTDTACVGFDRDGACIEFLVNPEFWNTLNYQTKLFVICHECLHVILNHGKRSLHELNITSLQKSLLNIAMDIVINETIVEHFDIRRRDLNLLESYNARFSDEESTVIDDPSHPANVLDRLKEGAFVDTIFYKIDPTIPHGKSYEFYYDALVEYFEENIKTAEEMDALMDAIMQAMQGEHTETGSKELDRVVEEVIKSVDKESLEKMNNASEEYGLNGMAGDPLIAGALERLVRLDAKRIKKLKSWQSLFRRYIKKQQEEKEEYQWVHPCRRHSLLPKDFLLPAPHEDLPDDDKYQVWLFIDSSGSCGALKDRFFKAAYSIDPMYFDVRLFGRDTQVRELDYHNPVVQGGGSDRFQCIEDYIQEQLTNRKIDKYPEIVMHFTDGYDCALLSDSVNPEKPLNWWWFLTDTMFTDRIPKECINNNRVYKLSKFES